ncbi:MAG: hypothetical protein ABL890_01150 [Candidatus Peribacteraceae bacterium]
MYTLPFSSADEREKRLIWQEPETPNVEGLPTPALPQAPRLAPANQERPTESSPANESSERSVLVVEEARSYAQQAADEIKSSVKMPGAWMGFTDAIASLLSGDIWQKFAALFGWKNQDKKSNSSNQEGTDLDKHPANCGCGQHGERPRRHCGPKMGMELLAKYNLEDDIQLDHFTAGIEKLGKTELENAIFQVRNDIYNKNDEYQGIHRRWNDQYARHQRATRPINTAAFQNWPSRRKSNGRIQRHDYMAGKRAEIHATRDKYGALEKLHWGLIHEWGKRHANGDGTRNDAITRKQSQQLWREHFGAMREEEGNRDGDSVRATVLRRNHEELHRYDGLNKMMANMKQEEEERMIEGKRLALKTPHSGFHPNNLRRMAEQVREYDERKAGNTQTVSTPSSRVNSESSRSTYGIIKDAMNPRMDNYTDTTGTEARDAFRLQNYYTDKHLDTEVSKAMNMVRNLARSKNMQLPEFDPGSGSSRLIQLVPPGGRVATSAIRIKETDAGEVLYEVIQYHNGQGSRDESGPPGTVSGHQTLEDAVNYAFSMLTQS